MSATLELCIVGAGSSYTPELVDGILAQSAKELPIAGLRLSDVDGERLGVMASLTERMIRRSGRSLRLSHDTRLAPMLEGVDFAVAQIRVGGMRARHLDESIPLEYGVIGQETTGPGGMLKALRTIPPMLEIARTLAKVAPKATILNYTNPSGIITEAVLKHSDARIIGLCSGIPGVEKDLREWLKDRYPDLEARSAGLNHLGFIYRLTSGGRDVTEEAIGLLAERRGALAAEAPWWRLAKVLGAIPMRGYSAIFFNRARRVAEAKEQERTRAESVAELERQVFAEARDPALDTKPPTLAKRGGGGYSEVTFCALKAMLAESGGQLVLSTANRGAIEGIPDDAAVEVTSRIGRSGATPIPVGPLPIAFRGVVLAVKAYESLTVEAAVKRDRRLALHALLNHPLCGDLEVAEPMLDELLRAHALDFR